MAQTDPLSEWFLHGLPASIPAWLSRQRWFGGKARTIAAVHVIDVLWLARTPQPRAVVILDVRYAGGTPGTPAREQYALLLGVYDAPDDRAVISTLPWDAGRHVADGADGAAILDLLRDLRDTATVRGIRGGALTCADATDRAVRLAARDEARPPDVVPVGVEQSNTSVRIGSAHVFKLLRRLEPGVHPQLEIGRRLALTGCTVVPPLEGSLTYHAPDGTQSALGALEGWVDNSGDGWRHVTAGLRRAEDDRSVVADLVTDLTRLGATTADFHAALATGPRDEAFSAEPVTTADIRRWVSAVHAQAERTVTLVERHRSRWPGDAAELGRHLVRLRSTIAPRLAAFDAHQARFSKTRVHGDYHLGQTLKTPTGFAIIDFEGEPSKSLSERRAKHCVLRDVAGMLRSIEYARQAAGVSRIRATARLRDAFTEGYLTAAARQETTLLPPAPAQIAAWTSLFELEKALYEVEYEANNRPEWVRIPLTSVLELLDPRGA